VLSKSIFNRSVMQPTAGRFLLVVLGWMLLTANVFASDPLRADSILIKKGDRKLYLMQEDRVIREIDVLLGLMPEGDKTREGDFRTPEGNYNLTRRNPDSHYFLSIQISYPNKEDAEQAYSRGVRPGGSIMIHGQPNKPKHDEWYYERNDWTDGCIAVSDTDMVDIWMLTQSDTPITILP
jgi:murein L,D-transpeptidase YafK